MAPRTSHAPNEGNDPMAPHMPSEGSSPMARGRRLVGAVANNLLGVYEWVRRQSHWLVPDALWRDSDRADPPITVFREAGGGGAF